MRVSDQLSVGRSVPGTVILSPDIMDHGAITWAKESCLGWRRDFVVSRSDDGVLDSGLRLGFRVECCQEWCAAEWLDASRPPNRLDQ